ncbi:hypothetical protein F5I97DRAFT_1887020 [Phlebopus sp. FC_14]|nr:hypothetical protein F5I97DRAFT_1887020 [Phlebopus sp. FC_14]
MSTTRSGNNPTGVNGYGVKNCSFSRLPANCNYSKERLTVAERLTRLHVEFGLSIGKTRLHALNKQFGVPSTHKLPPEDIATQAILEKVADNVNQVNGVNAITSRLSTEGIPLPQDFVRSVLARHAPDRSECTLSRSKASSPLCSGGHWSQSATPCDGFAKLNAQALQMGGIRLDIYGIKDQWSSFLLHLVVVPNHRLATTIGHVYLDYVQKYQAIPATFVTDKGSETGIMYGNQEALRTVFAPDIDVNEYPPFLFLKSIHNTPIEGLWHWFAKTQGINMKTLIQSGRNDGIYHLNKDLHKQLFYWLWPQILQEQLDKFVEYWNNHRIRYQKDKPNPSGTTPRHAFTAPQACGGQDCKVAVMQDVLDALRVAIPVSQKESMCWVSDDFAEMAGRVYIEIRCPDLVPKSGWTIFSQMEEILADELQVDTSL